MQTNPAVEQKKNVQWSESPWNQSGRWGKSLVLWRKKITKKPSLKFRIKHRTKMKMVIVEMMNCHLW